MQASRSLSGVQLAVVAGIVSVGTFIVLGYRKEISMLEKPKYKILQKLGLKRRGFLSSENYAEVREYLPYLLAEVTFEGEKPINGEPPSINSTSRAGFRQVANFIFGNNTAVGGSEKEKVAMTAPVRLEMAPAPGPEKIAMTAPVRLEVGGASSAASPSSYKLSFVMPSKYTAETLPKPNNENIKIREVPAKLLAAVSFSGGSPREAEVESKRAELLELLKGSGYRVIPGGPTHLWQYHPPFMPGFLRLNEVLVEVEKE